MLGLVCNGYVCPPASIHPTHTDTGKGRGMGADLQRAAARFIVVRSGGKSAAGAKTGNRTPTHTRCEPPGQWLSCGFYIVGQLGAAVSLRPLRHPTSPCRHDEGTNTRSTPYNTPYTSTVRGGRCLGRWNRAQGAYGLEGGVCAGNARCRPALCGTRRAAGGGGGGGKSGAVERPVAVHP